MVCWLSTLAAWTVHSAAQCTTVAVPGITGTDGLIYHVGPWDDDGPGPQAPVLFAYGGFSMAGNVALANIGTYDPAANSWAPFGAALNGQVAITVRMPNGDIVVGGQFTMAGGVPVNYLARWDGSTWSPLGSGTNGDVWNAVLMPNGDVVVVGNFTTAGNVSAAGIARWDGNTWSALGVGNVSGSEIYSMTSAPNGDLILGGYFATMGGVQANSIVRWDGTTWSALAAGLNSYVLALATLPNGDLVAGGTFTGNIARWDGTSWSVLGQGMNLGVNALAVLPNGDLLASGGFTAAGGVAALRIARWDGASWSAFGPGVDDTLVPCAIYSFAVLEDGDVIAGGSFAQSGGVAAANLARFRPTCRATAVPAGAGCTGSAGPNVLLSTTQPWIGTVFHSTASGMTNQAIALSVLGLGTTAVPLPTLLPQGMAGCSQWVTPDALQLHVPTAGSLSMQVAIPNSMAFANVVLYQQVFAAELDLQGSVHAVTSTNSLALTLGRL